MDELKRRIWLYNVLIVMALVGIIYGIVMTVYSLQ